MEKDLTGQQFGRFKVLGRDTISTAPKRKTNWICQCSICGRIRSVRRDCLMRGISANCYCRDYNKPAVNISQMRKKYGCTYCADYNNCKVTTTGVCLYAQIFDEAGGYNAYDREAKKDIYATVAAFPDNI